ncbi:hypothetical protein TNCV_3761351 [Trichonephila clavipes]|nr:hypothetical protein TNCV_3761351 [Trichonephila clavipes]
MVRDSLPACHEFEPSTAEDPPCRKGAMNVKSGESSNVLAVETVVWYLSSSSLGYGSKLRGTSKALE